MGSGRIVVIGCGGIWSYLWKALARMMSYEPGFPRVVHLWDADQFAASNLERQDMTFEDRSRNKAEIYADRIKGEFPAVKVTAHGDFISERNMRRAIKEGDFILSLVDNHPTRRLLARRVRELKDAILISGANDELVGNVHLHLRKKGKEVTLGMDRCHPEIEETTEKNPADMSCGERAMLPGGGQTIVANMQTATLVATYLRTVLKGGNAEVREMIKRSEVFFNLKKLVASTVSRKQVSGKGKKEKKA